MQSIQRLKALAEENNNWQDVIVVLEGMAGENAALAARVDALESSAGAVRERLDHYESVGGGGGAIDEVSKRLDALEAWRSAKPAATDPAETGGAQ